MSTEIRGPTGRLPPRTYGEYCERPAERVVSEVDTGAGTTMTVDLIKRGKEWLEQIGKRRPA